MPCTRRIRWTCVGTYCYGLPMNTERIAIAFSLISILSSLVALTAAADAIYMRGVNLERAAVASLSLVVLATASVLHVIRFF